VLADEDEDEDDYDYDYDYGRDGFLTVKGGPIRPRLTSSWTCDRERGYPGASRHSAQPVRDTP